MLNLFFPRSHRELMAIRHVLLQFSPQVSRPLMLQFGTETFLVPQDSGCFCSYISRVGNALRTPKDFFWDPSTEEAGGNMRNKRRAGGNW